MGSSGQDDDADRHVHLGHEVEEGVDEEGDACQFEGFFDGDEEVEGKVVLAVDVGVGAADHFEGECAGEVDGGGEHDEASGAAGQVEEEGAVEQAQGGDNEQGGQDPGVVEEPAGIEPSA